jgi:hypothetical protein
VRQGHRRRPRLPEVLAQDAGVICVNGFRIYPIGREIVKGEYFKLSEVVQEHKTYFPSPLGPCPNCGGTGPGAEMPKRETERS